MTSGELYGCPELLSLSFRRSAVDNMLMVEKAKEWDVPLYMVEMFIDGDSDEAVKLMKDYRETNNEHI